MKRIKFFVLVLAVLSTLPLLFCSCDECEHQWDDGFVTKEPTTSENGYRIFTCTLCDDMRYEEISKLVHTDHEYSSKWGTDTTSHWLICDFDGCEAVTNKTEHTWVEKHGGGYICQVCRYVKES